MNLWVFASIDGYINLYIKVDTAHYDYVFLSASPLPSFVIIRRDNKISEIFVYSINGKL